MRIGILLETRRGIGRWRRKGRGENGTKRGRCIREMRENWFPMRFPIYYTRSCAVNVCPRRHLDVCASRFPRTRLERAFRNATGSSRVVHTIPRGQHRRNKLYCFSRRRGKEGSRKEKRSSHKRHVTRKIITHYITSTVSDYYRPVPLFRSAGSANAYLFSVIA